MGRSPSTTLKMAAVKETMEVGYWKIRGLGAPLRMMCYYKESEASFSSFNTGPQWFGEKKPGLAETNAMINLPYIQDGAQVITQSNSCMLYLGRKLAIDEDANFIKNHQALDQIMDLRNDVIKIVYPFAGCAPPRNSSQLPWPLTWTR